jgi:magnesium chelatase family protein
VGLVRRPRRLTPWLPAVTLAEALETTRIYRVAARTGARTTWATARLFRAPHQTISAVGLSGRGHIPIPGDVSRVHHRMLWLDERPSSATTCSKSCVSSL